MMINTQASESAVGWGTGKLEEAEKTGRGEPTRHFYSGPCRFGPEGTWGGAAYVGLDPG